jgi:hypothetical protein
VLQIFGVVISGSEIIILQKKGPHAISKKEGLTSFICKLNTIQDDLVLQLLLTQNSAPRIAHIQPLKLKRKMYTQLYRTYEHTKDCRGKRQARCRSGGTQIVKFSGTRTCTHTHTQIHTRAHTHTHTQEKGKGLHEARLHQTDIRRSNL